MSTDYQRQQWNSYDYEQSIKRNIERNAVVTEENMNHMEEGIALANRRLQSIVRTGANKFNVDIKETNENIIFDFSFPDIETDIALELKGVPADAKATGDALDALTYGIKVLNERMNTISKLPEGSTTADYELADIRVTINGDYYDHAGDAVRAQFNQLNSALNTIKDSLNEGFGVASISNDNSYEPLEEE